MRTAWSLFTATLKAWMHDDASTRAAALAYYGVFSLAPTLLIALTVAGAVLGEEAAHGEVRAQLTGVIGDEAARSLEALIASAAGPGTSLVSTIAGVLVLVFAASGAFAQMQDALNAFWHVPPDRTQGVRAFLERRMHAVFMVFACGLVLLVLVLSSALLPSTLNQVFAFCAATALFAALFKFVPARHVPWRHVWLGAIFTSVLFNLGKVVIAGVLLKSAFAPASGAVGAVAALLAWVYYSALIFFLGAEFTQVVGRSPTRG